MAAAKNKTTKIFVVKVKNNKEYCGEGAGGAQFAHGEARITSERLANWYREHKGYSVTETEAPEAAAPEAAE